MQAKLIKTPEGLYKLKFDNDNDMLLCATALLSAKNCDEIFGVVDVEKIADRHTFGQRNHEWKAYIAGFNKAMELNKDKVFTLEVVHAAFGQGWERSKAEKNGAEFYSERTRFLKYIQQPTEIEVTFNPEEKDSDGCLILTKL